MLFNSYVFLCVFLPLALIGYYGLARIYGPAACKVWLCAASFVFYGWWNPAFVFLLAGSIAFNYLLSLYVVGDDEASSPHRGKILAAGIAANLLLLFHYKYLFPLLGFFYRHGWTNIDFGSIVLPLGISFFTFTQIGYLVDCQQGLVRDRNFLNYVLFVTFFPHLIAGPILHHREIMPQFASDETYRLRAQNLSVGLTLFAFGLFKKVMFADTIAPWAESGFAHVHGIEALQAWSVALAYSMQLYFDFSGYSDMAVGIGIMFAISLPLNFNSPYKSMSIIDFWQRFHMTLTRYLTLLLYNPIALAVTRYRQKAGLASNRKAAATPSGFASMIGFPTLTTMFLAGVWHGAGLQFMIFGLLHGLYLTANNAWRIFYKPFTAGALNAATLYSILWRVALTYFGVLLAQIFFRANDLPDALVLLGGMFGFHGSGFPLTLPQNDIQYLGPLRGWLLNAGVFAAGAREIYNSATLPLLHNWAILFGLGLIAFAAPNVYQILNQWSPALTKVKPTTWHFLEWRPTWITAMGSGVILFIATLYFDRTARFLYFQF
jgi:alginate O-acetyltransferase complex protein AlgI